MSMDEGYALGCMNRYNGYENDVTDERPQNGL